jgi:serine/threonine protein kinase
MASPVSVEEFLELVHKSGVADDKRVDAYVAKLRTADQLPREPAKMAGLLVRDGYLTHFQAEHILQGKWRRFTIGKYKVLEKLGSGGMGQVFLCEHKLMRAKRAIKILPTAKAQDEAALGRFYREARAVAAIDHPNIVHAYDIDQDENLHFLVIEYVDGSSLQDIVKKSGPLSVLRSCHYIRQSAIGLEHARRVGLVHRDIKPGNILVARDGAVKILDMGLARFFNDDEDILTKKFDEAVLGTADYLAPEQAIDSHEVDIRADIYSLGATFYYLLTGKTPFPEGTVAQKLLWHQTRNPRPVRELRPELPAALDSVVLKMMAKDPAHRYQTPAEVADALAPFTAAPIEAPPESEMPRLSPAAMGKVGDGSHNDAAEATAISKHEPTRMLHQTPTASTHRPAKPPSAAPSTAPPPVTAVPPRSESSVKAPAPPLPVPQAPAAPQAPAQVAVTAEAPQAPVAAIDAHPEEEFTWQVLANETAEMGASNDTSPTKDKSGRLPATGERKAMSRDKGIVLLVVLLMGFAGCIGALVGGAFYVYSLLTAPPVVHHKTAPTLVVSQQEGGKRPDAYRTLREALRKASKGSVIEIADPVIEENVVVPSLDNPTTEVTIQPAPGKTVVWRPSKNKKPSDPLLRLTNAASFKLRGPGLILDGEFAKSKAKVKDLIFIVGSAPGLTLEDVQVKNFDRSCVFVMSAAGEPDSPIAIRNVTALTGPADKDGGVIMIDARSEMKITKVECIVIEGLQAPGVPAGQVVRCGERALGDRRIQIPGVKKD